ncbi:MAG: phosphoglucomutase/phosphomannomutase family protein [Dehalococcoidia bacterium]
MAINPVRFGTDGWRAIIAEEFTFENVRACAQATAEHFLERERAAGRSLPRHMVVGFDTRFHSEAFAIDVARVLAGNGFRVQLADRPAPTPALSYAIVSSGAAGGIIVTSSHNPATYNGIKVKPDYGGSASPEIVADIERRVPGILFLGAVKRAPADSDAIRRFDPIGRYYAGLQKQVDLPRVRAAGLRVAADPMFGAGAGLLSEILAGGPTSVTEIHADRNPSFPGLRAPEPIDSNLGALMALVAGGSFDCGLANDGDADRVGFVDEHGAYVDQLRTFAILVEYLLGVRGLRGGVVKSVTTSRMASLLAAHYGVPLFETPVGFKHIGPLMIEQDALIGGEESGGYGFRGHIPERDGILADLLLLDFMATTGKRPSEMLASVFAITGPHFYQRIDFDLEPGTNAAVKALLDSRAPDEIAGRPVVGVDRVDGWRFLIPEGWLLLRLSGTEPLLRVYTEVTDASLVTPVLDAGIALAGRAR